MYSDSWATWSGDKFCPSDIVRAMNEEEDQFAGVQVINRKQITSLEVREKHSPASRKYMSECFIQNILGFFTW